MLVGQHKDIKKERKNLGLSTDFRMLKRIDIRRAVILQKRDLEMNSYSERYLQPETAMSAQKREYRKRGRC
jgi:hypothetical protein